MMCDNKQLLLLVLASLVLSFTTAIHTCHGTGRIGDPLVFEDQTIPCDVFATGDHAILEYRLNLPVAIDFERQVQANAFATAFYQTDAGVATTEGVELQMKYKVDAVPSIYYWR